MNSPIPSGDSSETNLFAAALAKATASERASFLDDICANDPALRRRLDEMLADHFAKQSGASLVPTESPTLVSGEPLDQSAGSQIGPYKLLEKLGEGGFGSVYVAEQREPVKRRVALKIIKLGMDTRQVVARFEAERQALALMDHPNIAKVFDAGSTETGRPYFVMELVRGIPITRYCDEAHLRSNERLELFIQVCHAIQHAHQKGIIHRDIKPSNILVTLHDGVPVPKVIDFGIAKATQGELTDKTVYTQFEQVIGTPAYISPEQAEMSGLDIDTRSDIYSLGVLLYELLVGKTPFDAKELVKSGINEMRRIIREEEPVPPSTRLSHMSQNELTTTAKRRDIDAPKLIKGLRGDLDWIVMKCLEKDRSRRYETANALAVDIQHFLKHEPVAARPPSTTYRIQKLVRRNKAAVVAASGIALSLVVGLSLATVGLIRERKARAVAEERQLEADTARKAEAEQRVKVEEARANEAEQRRLAEANAARAADNEHHARKLLYAADMNLAQDALQMNNLGRARRLLDRHRPAEGEQDLRGWEWRHLWQQCQSDALATIAQRTARGFSVSFSPDGTRLAAGYMDGRIELWDVASRSLVRVLQTETNTPAHVAFSPTANHIVATAGRGTVKLHDIAAGTETVLSQGFLRSVRQVAYSATGSNAVAYFVAGAASSVTVFDPERNRIINTHPATPGSVHTGICAISPDGKRLFIGLAEPALQRLKIQCVNAETGDEIWNIDAGSDFGLTAMTISPDGQLLATGSGYANPDIKIWNAATGRAAEKLEGHTGWVGELAFSRDGKLLASAAADQTIRLWDVSNWTEIMVFRGHADEVHAVAFSPDGRFLASGGKDGAIMLWDVNAKQSARGYRVLPDEVRYASEVASGSAVGTISQDNRPVIINLKSLTVAPIPGVTADEPQPSFTPPNIIVRHNRTNWLSIYELQGPTSELIGQLNVGKEIARGPVAFSREHRLVAWSDPDGTLQIASLDDAARMITLRPERKELFPYLFSPDGRLLVVRDLARRTQEIREIATGKLLVSSPPETLIRSSAFANQGNTFVTLANRASGASGAIVIFNDLTNPTNPPIQFTERGTVVGFAVSKDGKLVAVSSQDGFVVLYDAERMERTKVLHGHMQGVHNVTFSADGTRLLSSSGGREAVKIWHVETGQELLTLAGKGSLLDHVEFAEDGDGILVGSAGRTGSWQLWRAPSRTEIDRVEHTQGRGLDVTP